MKKFILFVLIYVFATNLSSQTIIATSNHSEATANHNQRKIVRDSGGNMYVVFVDYIDQQNVVKGLMYDPALQQWGEAFFIAAGTNPTLAISDDDQIHLLLQSNNTPAEILHLESDNFTSWLPADTISYPDKSSSLPVADIDAAGKLNALWKQQNNDYTESLIYAAITDAWPLERKTVFTKTQISDIAIANHLQYLDNSLFFAMQYNLDSIAFFVSDDWMNSFDTLYAAIGSQPCISYNSFWQISNEASARFLYINTNNKLCEMEVLVFNTYDVQGPFEMPFWEDVEYVCIDDLASPIGYSFLSLGEGQLRHNFSYGFAWNNWMSTMEYISGNGIINPSIAYKHFNFEYVDFIWTDDSGIDNDIYYMRDAKHVWTGTHDPEVGKGFSITGEPNPFSTEILLTISVEEEGNTPHLEVYNTNSQLVKTLVPTQNDTRNYYVRWSGLDESSAAVNPGVYIIMCTIGDKRTARKLIFTP